MDIHKPKPVHGWREFVGEVGIIVLGVLIALGAEQSVEALHWRHEAVVERAVLRQEVADNLSAVQDRILLEPCVQKRLLELGQVLARASRNEPLGLTGPAGLPLPVSGAKGGWNIAVAGQGLSHMPNEEQLGFSNAFSNYENWDAMRREEREAWVRLAVLDSPAGLTAADWAALKQAYAQARAADARIRDVGPFIFRTASVGVKVDETRTVQQVLKDRAYGQEICQPLLAS